MVLIYIICLNLSEYSPTFMKLKNLLAKPLTKYLYTQRIVTHIDLSILVFWVNRSLLVFSNA